MNIGFTGTRRGMTVDQMRAVKELLEHFYSSDNIFHHGNCIGADEQAALMAKEIGYFVVAHPSNLPDAYQAEFVSDDVWPVEPPLVRNQDILDISEYMICSPRNFKMPQGLRGEGTWWTIDKALKSKQPMMIAFPDGSKVGI